MGPTLITTVVTAAASYDLTTLAIVKDELSITNKTSDAILQRYLTSSSAAAAQYCNRVFPAETITDEFWAQTDRWPRIVPGHFQTLQLSRWPVVSVSSVTENGNALVEDTDFRINAKNGQLVRLTVDGYPRPWPAWPLAVTYQGGFATIPVDVADAVIRMVKARWDGRGRDPFLMERNIPGVIEQRWWVSSGPTGNMPPDVTDLLDNYRVPVIG
jgi:hypothetical protein